MGCIVRTALFFPTAAGKQWQENKQTECLCQLEIYEPEAVFCSEQLLRSSFLMFFSSYDYQRNYSRGENATNATICNLSYSTCYVNFILEYNSGI